MSYQEKRTLVSIVCGIALQAAYAMYALSRAGSVSSGGLAFWAKTMLVFIGIGIAALIVIQIVFHILMSIGIAVGKQLRDGEVDDREVEKEIQREMVEDEMDKLIELKSMRTAFGVAGFGFIAALGASALGASPVVMLHILYFSFGIGSVAEGVTQIYFYRKGLGHGL